MLLLRPEVNEPSPAARQKAVRLLEQRLGPSRVLTGRDACERFSGDESEAEGRVPDAVVQAESRDDILTALAVAREAEVPSRREPAERVERAAPCPSRGASC